MILHAELTDQQYHAMIDALEFFIEEFVDKQKESQNFLRQKHLQERIDLAKETLAILDK